MLFPRWSFNSTLENFETTPSLKFSLISVGALAAAPSAGGTADLSVGWALAAVAIRLPANSAHTAIALFFNIAPSFVEGVGEKTATSPRRHVTTCRRYSAPVVVIVACVGMIFVKVVVQIPQGAVIRAVLGSTVETFCMRALVRFVYIPVEPVVLRMIARVPAVVVVIVVGQGGRSSCGQRQRCDCQYCFRRGHGRSR